MQEVFQLIFDISHTPQLIQNLTIPASLLNSHPAKRKHFKEEFLFPLEEEEGCGYGIWNLLMILNIQIFLSIMQSYRWMNEENKFEFLSSFQRFQNCA